MKIWISCTGNEGEPEDTYVNLPGVPHIGEKIEVWNARDGQRQAGGWSGTEHWLEVRDVIWIHDINDEQATVRVWVGIDGFGHEEMKQIFDAITRDDSPGEIFKGPYEAGITPSQRYRLALEEILKNEALMNGDYGVKIHAIAQGALVEDA